MNIRTSDCHVHCKITRLTNFGSLNYWLNLAVCIYNNNNNNNNNNDCPGYDIKLQPVVEFRRGIMRLPFATSTSRSLLSKV